MQRRNILLFVLTFFSVCAWSQEDKQIDSVLTLLKKGKRDTATLSQYLFISRRYQEQGKLELSVDYGKKGLVLSPQVIAAAKDKKTDSIAKKYQADIYNMIGVTSIYAGDYDAANENCGAALEISKKINYRNGIFNANNVMGSVNSAQGNYREALKKHFSNVELFKKDTDKPSKGRLARSYANIGNSYGMLGENAEAIKYQFMALKLNEEIGRKAGVAIAYTNIGAIYSRQGKVTEAIKYESDALRIYKEMGDNEGIARMYHNIAAECYKKNNFQAALENLKYSEKIAEEHGYTSVLILDYHDFSAVYTQLKKYELALECCEKSVKLCMEADDKAELANTYSNLGTIYSNQNKFAEGEKYYRKALEIGLQIGGKGISAEAYLGLTNLYENKGDYEKAFDNHKKYILYHDSISNEDTRKMTVQAEMNFQFEKKEAVANAEHEKEMKNQQELASEKNRKQTLVLLFVGGSLILVIIFAFFISRSLRTTRKQKSLIEKQKEIVEQQKLEVEHQKAIVEEHQKEIIDSITYARRIQRSLLPTEKYIQRSLDRLRK